MATTKQGDLLDNIPPLPDKPRFDGDDYVPERDDVRLTGQLYRIWSVISSGKWYTLREIADKTGDPEASISAQLRHLRKPRFGSHVIQREYLGNGLYRYRLNDEEDSDPL